MPEANNTFLIEDRWGDEIEGVCAVEYKGFEIQLRSVINSDSPTCFVQDIRVTYNMITVLQDLPSLHNAMQNIDRLEQSELMHVVGFQRNRLEDAEKNKKYLEAKLSTLDYLHKNPDKKIGAIKRYRDLTGEGLKESKEYVEKLIETYIQPF